MDGIAIGRIFRDTEIGTESYVINILLARSPCLFAIQPQEGLGLYVPEPKWVQNHIETGRLDLRVAARRP
jgi:hypothetical protein